jgi:hypothetical protein
VVGTSAAVTYDVGYFIGVGMISEHIGFALLALPEVACVLLVRGRGGAGRANRQQWRIPVAGCTVEQIRGHRMVTSPP